MGQLLAIIGQRKYRNLCVWSATNYFSKLDVALLRDGRQEFHHLLGPMRTEEAKATCAAVLAKPEARASLRCDDGDVAAVVDELASVVAAYSLNLCV